MNIDMNFNYSTKVNELTELAQLLIVNLLINLPSFAGKKQAEAKKLEDLSLYLNLPATKLEMEEKGYAAIGKSMQNLGNCTISKDSFQISTLVCSTKLTQNGNSFYTSLKCIFSQSSLRAGVFFFLALYTMFDYIYCILYTDIINILLCFYKVFGRDGLSLPILSK